jgi:hypothetical protein
MSMMLGINDTTIKSLYAFWIEAASLSETENHLCHTHYYDQIKREGKEKEEGVKRHSLSDQAPKQTS